MEKARRKRAVARKPLCVTCRTCRSRKIRCGNERPSCNQCLQVGRECGGYNSWEVIFDQDGRLRSTGPNASPRSCRANNVDIPPMYITPRENLHNFHINDEMRHAFDYFRYRCYIVYAHRGYPTLWVSYAVALGISEPAVFLAAAALGTLEISVLDMVHTSPARPFETSTVKIALKLYSAAICWVRRSIADAGSTQGSLKPVIIACLVFVVFEVTRGNTLNAMRHARIGNRILNERLGLMPPLAANDSSRETNRPNSTSPPIADLDSVGLCHSGEESSLSPDKPSTCLSFSTLEEARQHLEALTEAAQEVHSTLLSRAEDIINIQSTYKAIQKRASRYCLAHTLSKSIPLTSTSQLEEKVTNIQRRYLQWHIAFTDLLESGYPPSRNVLCLQVRYFCASLPFFGCRTTDESWTDAFHADFSRTLDAVEKLLQQPDGVVSEPVARSLIQRLDMAERNCVRNGIYYDEGCSRQLPFGPQPSLSVSTTDVPRAAGVFEHGILPALLMVACKCRDPILRHRAVELLNTANRMEALVSSHRLAKVARAVVALEEQLTRQYIGEELLSGVQFASQMPEAARLSDIVASSIDGDQLMTLSCTQYDEQGCVTLLEYRYTEKGVQTPTFKETFRWQNSPFAA